MLAADATLACWTGTHPRTTRNTNSLLPTATVKNASTLCCLLTQCVRYFCYYCYGGQTALSSTVVVVVVVQGVQTEEL